MITLIIKIHITKILLILIFFPEKIEEYIPLVMDDEELETYMRFDIGDHSVVEEDGIGIILNADDDNVLKSFCNCSR